MICNECETVAHCTKHGCIPKQTALDKKAENARDLGLDYEPVPENFIDALKFDVAIRDAAPTVQEPVLWLINGVVQASDIPTDYTGCFYTSPPASQRQWVGLTAAEVDRCWNMTPMDTRNSRHMFAYSIEAKLRSKNNG